MVGLLVVPGIDALERHLGSEVGVTDFVEVSQEQIDGFAELTGDHQWIHTDPERAKRESPFGGTVAHGFLTLALLSRFVNDIVLVEGARLIVNCGLSAVRFIQPARSGGRIRARVRLRECQTEADFTQATWRVTIEGEGDRSTCCVANWVVRYYA